jgi:hypothetical protein
MGSTAKALDSRVEVGGLPRLDRFFPDCALGLVELVAQKSFGLPNLKMCWFANTFEYRAPHPPAWLNANRVELAGRLFIAGTPREEALQRLRRFYGIRVEKLVFDDFDALIAEVHRSLSRGTPAMSEFDMALLLPPGRSNGRVQPHMIGVIGCDVPGGTLRIAEQLHGEVIIPLSQYQTAFHRFQEQRCEFSILRCVSDGPEERPRFTQEEIASAVRGALDNLTSSSLHLGLNALRRAGRDVAEAIEVERAAFAIPGQWIFSHDRHALRGGLPYWHEAGVITKIQQGELDKVLAQAFRVWFQIDMTIERALHRKDLEQMREASTLWAKVVMLEERLAALLEGVVS